MQEFEGPQRISTAMSDHVSIATASPRSTPRDRQCPGSEREALRRAILDKVVLLGDEVTFDFKELLTQTRHVSAVGRHLWALIRPYRPEVLIGPGFGGAPLLYAIALAALESDGLDLAVWMVRDQRKTYYRRRWIEGPILRPGARAVLVDDFLGKGSAVSLMDEALAAEGRDVVICAMAVVFDQWQPLGSRQLSVSRFPVLSLFKRHDLGLTRDCHDARPPLMRGSAPAFVNRPLWWRFDLNGSTEHPFKSSPAIAGESVFAADDSSRIRRFDALSGEAVWCTPSLTTPYKGIVQRLSCVDGSLVVGCYDGTVTRLDAATGTVLWRWRVDSHVHATPIVDLDRGRVFVNTEQSNNGEPLGHLCALDWTTGRVAWRRPHGFWPPATVAYGADDSVVVATCNDRSIVAVDAEDGSLRWRAETRGLVRGSPALTSDWVLVATEDGFLQAFDRQTGTQVRQRRHGSGLMHQFLHVSQGAAYVLDASGHLVAFDVADFRIRWMGRLRSPGVWAPLPLGAYLLVLSREGHLAVFDTRDGTKAWEGSVGGTYRQQPAVGMVGRTLLLACASHHSGLKVFQVDPFYQETQ